MARTKRTYIGENILKYRKQTGLKQVEVADRIGIKRGTYAKYETSVIPPVPMLAKIGAFFGITTDDLLATSDNNSYIEHVKKLSGVDIILKSSKLEYSKNIELMLEGVDDGFSDEEVKKILSILTFSREQRSSVFDFIDSAIQTNKK